MGMLNEGDEVIFFEPYFSAFEHLCKYFGAKIKFVNLY